MAPGFRLITLGDDREYDIRGSQWLWFLVRDVPELEGRLGHIDRWHSLTTSASGGDYVDGRWDVSYPVFNKELSQLNFQVPNKHRHYRRPQVLQLSVGGENCEVIGCHLKNKINSVWPKGDPYA